MSEDLPMSCSLERDDLEVRLAEISPLGAERLVARAAEGDRHLLRFRADADTRQRLEAIVAAEADCCSFLDLSLRDEGDALVLVVTAPEQGEAVADGLATAFAGGA